MINNSPCLIFQLYNFSFIITDSYFHLVFSPPFADFRDFPPLILKKLVSTHVSETNYKTDYKKQCTPFPCVIFSVNYTHSPFWNIYH